LGRYATSRSSSAWVSESTQCRFSNHDDKGTRLTLPKEQVQEGVERTLPPLARIERLPLEIVDGEIEQGQEHRERRGQRDVYGTKPTRDRSPGLGGIAGDVDREIPFEEVNHR
jgi:hypothetical protein